MDWRWQLHDPEKLSETKEELISLLGELDLRGDIARVLLKCDHITVCRLTKAEALLAPTPLVHRVQAEKLDSLVRKVQKVFVLKRRAVLHLQRVARGMIARSRRAQAERRQSVKVRPSLPRKMSLGLVRLRCKVKLKRRVRVRMRAGAVSSGRSSNCNNSLLQEQYAIVLQKFLRKLHAARLVSRMRENKIKTSRLVIDMRERIRCA